MKQIILENISLSINSSQVLANFSIEIEKGMLIILKGSYSSGALELLKIIGGIIEPEEGRVLIEGVDINIRSIKSKEEQVNSKTAFVFKSGGLISNLSIRQNFILPMNIFHANLTKREKNNLILTALKEFNLSAIIEKRPFEVPKDIRKMVGFIRALLINPSILLMDEPLSDLSEDFTEIVFQKIMENKKKNITQILLDHTTDNFLKLADGVIAMENGEKIFEEYGTDYSSISRSHKNFMSDKH